MCVSVCEPLIKPQNIFLNSSPFAVLAPTTSLLHAEYTYVYKYMYIPTAPKWPLLKSYHINMISQRTGIQDYMGCSLPLQWRWLLEFAVDLFINGA